MAVEKKRIVKTYLVLCEGVDTQNFLIRYLNSEALKNDLRFSNEIQTFDFGGIDQLDNFISRLKNMENFENVSRLLILRDAGTDAQKAIHMIQKTLETSGLPVPEGCNLWSSENDEIKTAFTLMPSCSAEPVSGTLEDLCWNIIKDDPDGRIRSDVQKFVDYMNDTYNSIQPHRHKSRLHTYFSVNVRYISQKIGEAANTGAFDWSSPELNALKKLLKDGFE